MDWKDGAILATAGLGILVYDSLISYKALQVDIAGYQIYNVDFSNNRATLQVDVRLTNPLLIGLTLYSIVGDVYIDGRLVAQVNRLYDYYIRGKRTHIIPLVINCNIWEVVRQFMDSTFNPGKQVGLSFVGQLRLGSGGVVPIPLEFEENIQL